MVNYTDLQQLFASVAEETEKVASQAVDSTDTEQVKLAEDLYAAGEIMAAGFINAALEKLAGSGVPAAGGGDPMMNPRSRWDSIAKEIANRHGRTGTVGDSTSVRAEGAGALSGAKGSVNPQTSLG